MKKILLLLTCFIFNLNTFSQVRIDVWDKTPVGMSRTNSTRPTNLPNSFQSKSPDGQIITYEKINVPTIKVETSLGKKYDFKPNSYKSKDGLSIITKTENGWTGMIQNQRGEFYSMSETVVGLDTLSKSQIQNCKYLTPKLDSSSIPKPQHSPTIPPTGKTIPETSNTTNLNFYDKNFRIDKVATVYVEVSNDLHVKLGSSLTSSQNWVNNILLAIANVYNVEGITVQLSKMYIWETKDPYGYTTITASDVAIQTFTQNINLNLPTTPVGHFKHLLTSKGYGGIAWVGGSALGFGDPQVAYYGYYSCALSGISSTTLPNPVTSLTGYNWPVYCTSHEMGHNMGSKHTQSCMWFNSSGAQIGRLDSCYPGEQGANSGYPNCGTTTKTTKLGTIMSYCHTNGGGSFMLQNGFGQYPRHAIRSSLYYSAIPFLNPVAPPVALANISSFTQTSVNVISEIYNTGGSPILSRGLCWAVAPAIPTVNDSKVSQTPSVGNFTGVISGLLPGTTYNIKAYATNNYGTSYSMFTRTVTTLPVSTPIIGGISLTNSSSLNPSTTSVTLSVSITQDGGSSITEKGVVFSTTNNTPTILDSKVISGSGSAGFTTTVSGLIPNTTYYARGYVINSIGTSYTSVLTIKTLAEGLSVISNSAATGLTSASAILNATAVSSPTTITKRGFIISYTNNYSLDSNSANLKFVSGSGLGSFSTTISSLSSSTTYYYKSYAINSAGISYSPLSTFTTYSATLPSVSTTTGGSLSPTSIITGGTVLSEGGSVVTQRGICWSQGSTVPTISNSTITSGTGIGSYSIFLSGLLPSTQYVVRSYAINSFGTGYGGAYFITTPAASSFPIVLTNSVSSITTNSAICGGTVTYSGGSTVTARGVVWSTSQSPTISLSTKTIDGSGEGAFTSSITGLSPAITYYVRAYATNSSTTVYGTQFQFTTISNTSLPILSTTTISSISSNAATANSQVLSIGSSDVTIRGICYSTSPNPTTSNSVITSGSGIGAFSINMTGLSPNTLYYVRSYAINSSGTAYGTEVNFTTSQSVVSISTNSVTSPTSSSAVCGGNIISDGGSAITQRGVCWSTTTNPTISNSRTIDGSGVGSFTSNITGLSPTTLYYVRAYATNSSGTFYGNQVSFTTNSGTFASVSTNNVTSISMTTALCGGTVSLDGGSSIIARGVCWSTTTNPTISNSFTSDGTGLGSFSSNLTGLSTRTLYYVRSYVTNSAGTSYGNQVSFTTTGVPLLSTTAASNITSNSFTTGGNITSAGGGTLTVTNRGICYSTTPNPSILNSTISSGTGVGTFTINVTGLSQGVTYYVKAFATNSNGTGYGSEISVITSNIPSVTTTSITSITSNSAVSGGNITDQGSQIVTARGVVWSSSPNPTISLSTKTSNGSGIGIFTSQISSLLPSTIYYVRAYATNGSGTAYGNELQFTTQSSGSTSCAVVTSPAFKLNNKWRFKWNINPNCSSYTVDVIRYNYTNPNIQPPLNATPQTIGGRLKNYVPTSIEIGQGFIDKEMSPQPQKAGYWYNFRVTCNSNTCTGSKITLSDYFYVQ